MRNFFANYFKLINAYIKSIGQEKDKQALNEDQQQYNVGLDKKNENDFEDWLNNDH